MAGAIMDAQAQDNIVQDNAVRGNLLTPEQIHLNRLNELESKNAADPPGIRIGVGIAGESSGRNTSQDSLQDSAQSSAQPSDGSAVFFTTPALEAQRQAARQNSTESADSGVASDSGVPVFTWEGYFHAIGLLLLMLVLLWFLLRLARRFGKGRFLPKAAPLSRDELFLEGNLPLGPNRSVCVVRFLDRRLVLGVTDQQINYLTEAGTENFPSDTEFTEFMETTQLTQPLQTADSPGSFGVKK